ncbi:MAG TPA: FAD-dependent monooxygenase [Quisquiliibacterium sp.]|nr:FAD-dependent monooxygenase [Quisquiliibacterium sp.]
MYRHTSESAFDALVVGRGAIGASAALGLARAGLRVGVVAPAQPALPAPPSRAASGEWDPRVFAISPASRALLERLRVWDALDASRVAPVYDMRIYPSARQGAPELHFGAYEACVDALAWIVEGDNLSAALERALSFAGVAEIDGSVEAVDTTAPGHAEVALAGGRSLRAKLVVAADGARSPLRSMLGISAIERDYPQRAVVANFETGLPHRDCAWQWFGEHGILALLPLPGQRCSIVWSAPDALAEELLGLDPESFEDRVAQASWHVLGGMKTISAPQAFPLRLVQVERTIAPRAALIGDAAHVVHPLSGQGMNLGFGDVQALVDAVAAREPFRDPGDLLLLRRYERARREAVATMRLTTDGLQRLFDEGSPLPLPGLLRPLVGARELGWRLVESSPWLKRRLIAHAAS